MYAIPLILLNFVSICAEIERRKRTSVDDDDRHDTPSDHRCDEMLKRKDNSEKKDTGPNITHNIETLSLLPYRF